jgi:hypothetical protein
MSKHKVLYHGSSDRNIKVFEPRIGSTPRNFTDGPVVWATDELVRAIKFIVPCDDSWTAKGAYDGEHYVLVSDEDRFRKADVGGAVYKLPSDTFTKYKKGERISKVSVKPLGKIEYESGIKAMIDHGIKIYLISPEKLKEFHKNPPESKHIVDKLKKFKY